MADNTIANAIKFLKGEEKSLPATKTEGQVYFAYKNVGTAEKPSYTGAIYIDTPIGGTQTRVKMTANADIADKAFNDSAGLNIRETYLSSLGYTDDGKQTILIKGSGNNQTKIALPIASTTKSGIVTTDAQSFGGTKIFTTINSTNLTVTGSDSFNYSGIGSGTVDVARPVWFADNSTNGKPVVNTNFTYNPATQTLTVANLSGTADKANKDNAGSDIRSTYISNITVNGTTLTFTKGSGATSSITLQDNNNAVTQTAIKSSDYTNWRTVLWGASNSGVEGFTPTTVTDCVFTSDTLTFQPSSGTLKAKIFKGSLSGNASTAITASKAINDGSNQNIANTYVKYKSIKFNATADKVYLLEGNGAGSVTATSGSNISTAIIPAATDKAAGVITAAAQTFSGDKTFNNSIIVNDCLVSKAITGTDKSRFIILPRVPHSLIDSTHDTPTYFKALLKWICANYPNKNDYSFIGLANPNTESNVLIHIYDTGVINAEGYPEYSTGLFKCLGGELCTFGTVSYNYYCRITLMTNDKYAGSASSGGAATSANKLTTARTLWGQSFDGTSNVSGQISGCTRIMNANSGSLYLGNADNTGWVYTQDIASQVGQNQWMINQTGLGQFKNINIGYLYDERDASYALKVKGNTLYNGKLYFANNTTYYINESADANLRAVGTSDNTYIVFPQGGGYRNTVDSITGYLKITLPVTWTSTMMSFKVTIYEYQDNLSCTYYLSGYNYAGNNQWYSTSAYSLSKSDNRTISNRTVRFGHDGSKCAIYIGESNSTWNYPKVQISDIIVGHSTYDYTSWASGWSVGFTTALGTITKIVTTPNVSNSAATLQANAGSNIQPVYFANGIPVSTKYILNAHVDAFAGDLSTGGWKKLNGRGNDSYITVAYNNKAAAWNGNAYSASIVFGTADTKGLLDCGYNTPTVTFGGASTGSSSDDNPSWYFKLYGASGQIYTFPTTSKTLAASDGSNASGSWGISITGNANTATTASNADKLDGYHGSSSQAAGTYVLRDGSGYIYTNYINSNTSNNENPSISQIIVTNGRDNFYRKASLSHLKSSLGSMPASDVYAWAKASTKPSYSWGEITGKPSTFTPSSHEHSYVVGSYTGNGGQQNPNYFGTNKVGFLMMNTTVNGDSYYKDWIIMDCYSGGDVGGGVAFGVNRQKLGAYIMRSNADRKAWAESAELLHTSNYTSYTVTKSGGGASGTWGINVTGSAGSVAWGNVSGKPSTFTPSPHEHSYVLDVNNGSHTTFAYSKAGMNYGDYTWLAAWNGTELRAINKSQFATASHTHPYLPLSGGTMTGTINFTTNKLACMFGGSTSSYYSGVMHQNFGTEAIVFAATNTLTSFIFKCGQSPISMANNTWANITPSMQIKKQSVYINSLIANGVTPDYNLYVNGTTRCNGTLGVGNGSNAQIDFFSNSSSTIGARIKAYNDRIEFVFS